MPGTVPFLRCGEGWSPAAGCSSGSGRQARVTQISALAGSGKTFLLRSWLFESGLADSAAWVPVQAGERDPQRFWISVLDALRDTIPGSKLVRPLTGAPDLDGWAVIERLLEDLEPLEDPLWLVIDDLHELRSAEALAQLELLMMRAPAELRFVLVTRGDVRLGLHRLRLEGELTEIRAADLRFSLDEARALFAAAGVQLPDSALAALVRRTEGWAAGLRLAALSLAGHPDPERFAAEFSGSERTVAEYLLAEVLDHQSEPVRRLLLRTSVCERISGELADLLTGGPGGERILQDLEDAGAFVVALDARRSWFRYHQLFADLLQLELRRTEPAELAALHGAAAGWFAAHGYPVEAVRHAQAAQDWDLAARLLSDHFLGLVLDGQGATAHELLAGFPADMVAADPKLAVLMAADELFRRSLEAAERHLARAEQEMASVPADRRGRFQVNLAIMRLMLAQRRGDLPAVVEEAQRLLAPEDARRRRACPGDARTCARWRWSAWAPPSCGRFEPTRRSGTWSKAPTWRAGSGGPGSRSAPWRTGAGPRASGRSRSRPSGSCRRSSWPGSTAGPGSRSWPPPTRASAPSGSGRCGWRRRRPCWTRPSVRSAARSNRRPGWCSTRRAGCSSSRAAATARRWLPSRPPNGWPACSSRRTRARRPCERTCCKRSYAWATPDVPSRPSAGLDDTERGEMRNALAALRLAQGDPRAATAALAPVLDGSAPVTNLGWASQAFLLEAIARDALGDPVAAGRALERALDLAEPDGAVFAFVLHPAPELLGRHARRRTAHAALIAEILSLLAPQGVWGRAAPQGGSGGMGPPQGGSRGMGPPRSRGVWGGSSPRAMTEPLSGSETRVLRFLPTNLSAPEIAGQLSVSVNTVRTHMRHLYEKLGAHSRTEAVEQARALGLLAPSSRRP